MSDSLVTPVPIAVVAPSSPAPVVPAASPPTPKPPDALLVPTSWVAGLPGQDQTDLLCTYAEGVLGGDRGNGVTAHVRLVTPTLWFITLNYNDTLYHEIGHPREKKPRYVWSDLEAGAKQGVLTDDATPPKPMGNQTASAEPTNPLAKMAAELKRKAAPRAR